MEKCMTSESVKFPVRMKLTVLGAVPDTDDMMNFRRYPGRFTQVSITVSNPEWDHMLSFIVPVGSVGIMYESRE